MTLGTIRLSSFEFPLHVNGLRDNSVESLISSDFSLRINSPGSRSSLRFSCEFNSVESFIPSDSMLMYKVQKLVKKLGQIWPRGSRKRRKRTPGSAPISLRCTPSPETYGPDCATLLSRIPQNVQSGSPHHNPASFKLFSIPFCRSGSITMVPRSFNTISSVSTTL
jgi:hypothetical protein